MASLLCCHPSQLIVVPHRHSSWEYNRFLSWRTTKRCSATLSLRWMDVTCRGYWTSEKQDIPSQILWITLNSGLPPSSLVDEYLQFSCLALSSDLFVGLHSGRSDPCWIRLYQRSDGLGCPCSPRARLHLLSWFLEASSGKTWFAARQLQFHDVMQTNVMGMSDQIFALWGNFHFTSCCCFDDFYCRLISMFVFSPQLDDHGFERT